MPGTQISTHGAQHCALTQALVGNMCRTMQAAKNIHAQAICKFQKLYVDVVYADQSLYFTHSRRKSVTAEDRIRLSWAPDQYIKAPTLSLLVSICLIHCPLGTQHDTGVVKNKQYVI